MTERIVVIIEAWVLFLFGLFCLIDGLVALLLGKPCWIVRLGFGPLAITLSGVLSFIRSRMGG